MTKINIKLFANERIVVLPIPKTPRGNRYGLTNYGRVISFTTSPKEGNFLKTCLVSGYPAVSIRKRDTRQTMLLHRLVAQHFLRKPDKTYKFVLHLNHKKDDNHFKNLKWATFEEQRKHVLKNRMLNGTDNYKLTPKDVVAIKKMIQQGKYSLKKIAEKFGVTDMQISRIKSGENWGHVKV